MLREETGEGAGERAGQAPALPPRSPEGLFLAIMPPIALPVFLAAADSTSVATALPAIGASFGHVELLQWVMVANLIASTIAAPVYGRLGDLLGRPRLMLVAIGLFMLGSLCSIASPSLGWLLAARTLQGFGAGGLITLAQALLGANVPASLLGRYQGYFAACIVAGSSFGPVGGGFLTQWFGWPAVFVVNLPLGAVALLLVRRLPVVASHRGHVRFDLVGLVLLTLLVVPLLLALSQLRRVELAGLPMIAALLSVAALAAPALVWHQRRAATPLLPLALLREPAIWRANVMSACSGASLVAMVTFLPIYFQAVAGVSPARSGLLLLPLTAGVSGGSVLTGMLVSRTGRTAIFPMIGLTITALTLVMLALWAPRMSGAELSIVLAIGGLCQGTSMLVAQVTAQLVAGPSRLGVAAGSIQLSRSLGSAFGVAIAGTVLFAVLFALDHEAGLLFTEMVLRGPGPLAALSIERQAASQVVIAAAFRAMFLTVGCFSCLIVFAATTMPVRRLVPER